MAASFCLAKIHYLYGNLNAVDEALTRILSHNAFKDCYEALQLLAKVKSTQGKRYEAMALYKRLIEINPFDYKSNFDIAQMFEQIDHGFALKYYEQGIASFTNYHSSLKKQR